MKEKLCGTCKWWLVMKRDFSSCMPYDENREVQLQTEEEVIAVFGFTVRRCYSPKLLFCERPIEADFASVQDASNYSAVLLTGGDFGCVNHEI